ncbi:MAG: matrixin family metalloprotease [Planctomycetes bacterium]|nr:matrixin family metalloprotease [Planctomycetota bacterium]
MRKLFVALGVAALIAYPAARLAAHVRLIHPTSGAALRWSAPTNVGIVINSDGSDDIGDGSHETALRLAIQNWNTLTGTTVTLVEDDSATSQARRDYEATDVHLILFDESNDSGFFPPGSPVVALTPIWFFSNGVIQDADVLFNGSAFQFTTEGTGGRFDIQDVATHELGHLLGLDHDGLASATMYPYVDQGVVLQRSPSADELAGLRDAYPSGAFGQITGTVRRASDNSVVAGAYVVARDDQSRTRATILANASGAFTLRGLEPDVYTVYARPFDGPVDEDNLSSGWSGKIDTDFEPTFYAGTAAITGTNTVALGTLVVGADVSLSLGSPIDTFPIRATAGASQTIFLHGSGLFTGATLTASDPDLILGAPLWFGTQLSVQVTVPGGEASGHVDLTVTNASGDVSVLPGALELTPLAPAVTSVLPTSGTVHGGDALTITGSEFALGDRVVIGDRIYTDGVDATVVDANTITLTTAATLVGVHDVVVIDACGLEGRADDAFQVLSAPSLNKVLPRAGDSLGGTSVVLAGDGFVEGMQVRIDGIDQGPIAVSLQEARFTTVGGAIGGPYVLELENPDGALASQVFAYANQLDPVVDDVTPATGSKKGGTQVTLHGANFTPTMSVSFLATLDGTEVPAASVSFVDANTLMVTTPQHAQGAASLLIADANNVGTLRESAFTFTGGGGGGGGCYTVPFEDPRGLRAVLEGAWWLALVLGVLWLRARRVRGAAATA